MTMRIRTCLTALVLLASTTTTGWAQRQGTQLQSDPNRGITRVGTRGANFLEIGVGARELALGGAVVAAAEGLNSLYWNSSAIVGIQGVSGAVSYAELYGSSGVTHTYLAAALPLSPGNVIGASLTRFSSGDVRVTTEQWPTGGDPQRAEFVEWAGTAFGLHYSRAITDRLNVGISAKYIQEGITQATASYVGLDLSTIFHTGIYGITMGAAVVNVGTTGQFRGGAIETVMPSSPNQGTIPSGDPVDVELRTRKLQLPTAFRFGIRAELYGAPDAILGPSADHGLAFLTSIQDATTSLMEPSFGAEYSYRGMFFVRAGKHFRNEPRAGWEFTDGLSGGLGLRLPVGDRRIALDYAYTALGDALGHNQVFSFEFGF